jgi:Putative metallopeptidase
MRKCLEYIAALLLVTQICPARAESPIPAIEALSEEQQKEAVEFVLGNAIFVLFHEGGHMLVSEFELPVLGKEEDAVDSLSTLVLLEAGSEELDQAISDAADGWFLSDAQMSPEAEYAFWDEHSVDPQRAYAIVCMMVGQDAERFKEFAENSEFPADREAKCANDYEKTRASWDSLLSPNAADEGAVSNVDVVYDPPAMPELEPFADWLKEADVLGILKVALADPYNLEDGITFRATSCGEVNAFWNPQTREVTYCYELAEFHAALIAKYFAENKE